MNITKEFIEVNCVRECPYQGTCCKVSTEVIRHTGREGIDLFIFGMGAGKTEAELGRAFTGKAGKYMRDILKVLWEDPSVGPFNIAMSNNIRFHPMDQAGKDREPTAEEITRCIDFLISDIKVLDPKVIIPVGKNAANTFMDFGMTPMNKIRGLEIHPEIGGKVRRMIPTYHPSFLTRNYGAYGKDKNNFYDKEFISDLLQALE